MASVPQLRGLGMNSWSRALKLSVVGAIAWATWFKINVAERKKQMFIDFYKDYDDEKEFARMKKAGIFKGFEWSE